MRFSHLCHRVESFLSSHPLQLYPCLQILLLLSFWWPSLSPVEAILHRSFDFVFPLTTSDVEHLFLCLLMPFQLFAYFLEIPCKIISPHCLGILFGIVDQHAVPNFSQTGSMTHKRPLGFSVLEIWILGGENLGSWFILTVMETLPIGSVNSVGSVAGCLRAPTDYSD